MSANFQITCDQERPLSLPERLANICLISEMTDLSARLSLSLSLFISLALSLSLSIVAAANSAADQGHFALRTGFVLKPWQQPPMRGRGYVCVCVWGV